MFQLTFVATDSDALLARRLQMQEYGQPSYRAMPTPSPMFIPQLGGPMGAPSFMLHPHMMYSFKFLNFLSNHLLGLIIFLH